MTEATATITNKKLIDLYEKKISNVLSTSPEYSTYSKLIAEMSIMGLKYATSFAESRIVSGQETKKVQKLYTQFLINCTRIASKLEA